MLTSRRLALVAANTLVVITIANPRGVSADIPALRVGPVDGDIAARVRADEAALARCRAATSPSERAALRRVQRIVFDIGYGNDVTRVGFEPDVAGTASFRRCLEPIVLRWQLGRPETHEPAHVVVEGVDLRRILGGA